MKKLSNEQIEKLQKTADALFIAGTPSTSFARLIHNDYQIICNDDLNSPDDFYSMLREANKPMRDLLNLLGYNYSKFGICRLN